MILVTGVSGGLGGLILNGLNAIGDGGVSGGTRAGDGATARRIDFDDPASLTEGFKDVDVLVFVSAGYAEDDVVLARHGAVVDAATAAGVKHVVYTSLASSGERMTIALPHRWTEARLAQAPFDVTVLRNALYTEIPAGLAVAGAAMAAETGVFAAPFGDGRVSVVAKEDLAAAAVRVAAETDRDLAAGGRSRHAGKTYELEGLTAVGGAELAEALADALGRPVGYHPVSLAEAREGMEGSGLLPYQINHTLSILSNIKAGWTEAHRSDLATLLETAPSPVRESLTAAVKAGLTSGN